MNREQRAKMVLAMEYIVRNVNDEEAMDGWLMCGVADGDIDYGKTDTSKVDDSYLESETFRELMDEFLITMNRAYHNGGLYCDKVTSKIGSFW